LVGYKSNADFLKTPKIVLTDFLNMSFQMKKLIQLALLVALTMGFSSHLQAALLIEPVVGFNLGTKYDLKYDAFPVFNDSYSGGSGVSYGGRLGYQQLGLQLGLDYLKSSIDMNTSDLKENIST